MRILWQSYVDEDSSFTPYSVDANYPISNLYDTRLSRVYRSNDLELVKFSSAGSALNNNCESPAMCALTSTLFAFFTDSSDSLHVYEWNGSTFLNIGTPLVISSADYPALCAMTSSQVAFADATNEKLGAYEWNGSTWVLVGSELTISTLGWPAICALTTAQIAMADDGYDTLRTYEFDGSTWVQTGTASTFLCTYPALCALTSSLVVTLERDSHSLQAYEWNGSTWASVGNSLTLSTFSYISICAITSTLIAVVDSNEDLRAYDFNGEDFMLLGESVTVEANTYSALCSPTSSQIIYIGSASDNLTCYELDNDKNYILIKETCTPEYLGIVNHNISSDVEIYFEGASSSGFSTLTFSQSINWSSYTIISTITSTESCDYFRLFFNLHSTAEEYLSIGYLYVGNYIQMPYMKPDQTIRDETEAKVTISDGGQAYGDDNYSYRAPTINFPYLTEVQRAEIREMFASVKNYKPVITLIWAENSTFELPIYGIIDQNNIEWKRTDDPNMLWSCSLKLREVF